MPLGLTNTTITLEHITNLTSNVSHYTDFAININHTVFNGMLYFFILCILWIIMYFGLQEFFDQPLSNAVYSGVVITIISLLMRMVTFAKNGVVLGLITDSQMWLFPLITILLATALWITKD